MKRHLQLMQLYRIARFHQQTCSCKRSSFNHLEETPRRDDGNKKDPLAEHCSKIEVFLLVLFLIFFLACVHCLD